VGKREKDEREREREREEEGGRRDKVMPNLAQIR
jgi:hypothetical protein